MGDVRREALANFLRTHRAKVGPEDVGMAPGVRRRTPGLRREEVALLAGVGVTWYTWLEQGRDINPSPEVLGAIARTLQLDEAGTHYLFRMAGQQPPVGPAGDSGLPDHLVQLIHAQDPAPALIMDDLWDLRAWNAGADAVYGYSSRPAEDLNLAWLMFASTELREQTVDWSGHARRMLGEVRESFARRPEPGRLGRLLARLRRDFPEAARWLDEREVSHRSGGLVKELKHPVVGTLHLNQMVLTPAEAPDLQVVILQPVAGTDTAQRLAELAGRGQTDGGGLSPL